MLSHSLSRPARQHAPTDGGAARRERGEAWEYTSTRNTLSTQSSKKYAKVFIFNDDRGAVTPGKHVALRDSALERDVSSLGCGVGCTSRARVSLN